MSTTSGYKRGTDAWYSDHYNPTNDKGGKAATALLHLVTCAVINSGATKIEINNANRGFIEKYAYPLGFIDDLTAPDGNLIGDAQTISESTRKIALEFGYQIPDAGLVTANSSGTFNQLKLN